MERKQANKIAKEFIQNHNPDMWNGIGKPDLKFSTNIEVLNIFDNAYMTIQFEIDADENGAWAHIVNLYDKATNELIDGYFGYGIDSIENMTDTILDICKEYNVN